MADIMPDDIITFTCDERYAPYAKIFINSLNANSPGSNIIARLVNCKPETISTVRSLGPNIEVIEDITKLSSTRTMLSHGAELLYDGLFDSLVKNKTSIRSPRLLCSEQMVYCSNIKFITIKDLLAAGAGTVIYMDVDTIIRGSLVELISATKNADLCMFKDVPYTEQHPGSTRLAGMDVLYHGGLIGVNNNMTTRALFSEWVDLVTENMFDWDIDERLFSSVTEEIKIHNIDKSFKDEDLSEDSCVWSGAGQTKFTQDVYIEECKKYDSHFK